ncbi:glycoside hydrolase family 3 C-terminal domain-containing protein [Paenibacillus alkaliterrae]|uniref:glycoside hydrolase family 3 N-terminal domain-containing protein n=1 Tax=Paenibacillus alkaliterrae TaxID=320909 RepID=UPI001F1DB885|nr:glycoside hydrolase family 3 N-terminal domain-containing protein [Paenibacillus alkaliterrae]MCF2940470.1 glycoside hydrolase family 3 C-terminal domain-containing protein [Paenibacillus alkaliterrae]
MRYRNPSLSTAERVADLLGLMSIEEKIGQLIQLFGWKTFHKNGGGVSLSDFFQEEVKRYGVGSLYGTLRADPWTEVTLETGMSPREGAEAVNLIQKYAVEHSRLGIPILFGEECSHGHMAIGATVFPVPLSIGSTWNPALYERMCRAVAVETRSQGGAVTYSPVLDIVRDPRWGRTEENFSEDPFLVGEMAVAAVRGMQGDRLDRKDSIGVTLKHFVGYGASEGGRNGAPVHMGLRELHEIDLLPFRRGVEAGAVSIMTAYNEIDSTPCTSNQYLLRDVLRRDWGFNGFVITDCGAINMLERGHNVAANGEDAAAMALRAGVDMEMSGVMFRGHLFKALNRGLITQEEIDASVVSILTVKFRLGLFDDPYVNPEQAEMLIGAAEHKEIARKVAAEGSVLLKNDKRLLPLARDGRRIAVIGPNADLIYNQLGDYTSPQPREKVVTVLDGIRAKLADSEGDVLYAPGCRVKDVSEEGFDQAVACAAEADITVLVLGGSSARDFGEGTIDLRTGASLVTDRTASDMDCGEGIDRADLHLSGVQLKLAQAIHKLGKPLVVVYINGRPIIEPWVDEHADAILEAWYPGQEGGHAIADLLFGDANPSGKLPISIPRHAGQLPLVYNNKRTRGRYLETDMKPRYPFGYGMSYTEFKYEHLRIQPIDLTDDVIAKASVDVMNAGEVEGAEVVQLYISDLVSSVTRPEQELKGFKKIVLQPGESTTVTFTLSAEHLQLLDASMQPVVEEGEFLVRIGSSSDCYLEDSLFVRKS